MVSDGMKLPASLLISGSSKVLTFDKPVIRIGRGNDNDLVLDSIYVSRTHAELRYDAGVFTIADLGSAGGTLVNGVKIDQCILNEGDVITLANTHLIFGLKLFPTADQVSQYRPPKEDRKQPRETDFLPPLRDEK
jgi:pSer/pThr/pTyr-binding forkhead associated (FHA) protein